MNPMNPNVRLDSTWNFIMMIARLILCVCLRLPKNNRLQSWGDSTHSMSGDIASIRYMGIN